MKNTLLILCFSITTSFAQTLLLEENFDYELGTLTDLSSEWLENPTGSVDIQVIFGSLSYNDYSSSGIGNKILLNGGATGRSGISHNIVPQSLVGSSIYISFLLSVQTTEDMDINSSNGDYFFNLQNSEETVTRANLSVRQGTLSTKYNMGLEKSSSSTRTWYSNELDVGSTYLIVVSYTFVSGVSNDMVQLWINPNLSGNEPPPDLIISSGADAVDLGSIQYQQRTNSGDMEIDGIRIATEWSQAPLPVELNSFSAIKLKNSVKLLWQTETEVNNYGFEIEKQSHTSTSLSMTKWEKIGFVQGNGNSNSPKNYSFVDDKVSSGKYLYRLKQIDNDGQFEYSKTIEVDLGNPDTYKLLQNYPNPFNPVTTIEFNLPEAGKVKLTVYNLLGQEVQTLVNEFKEPGIHTINFNGSDLQSGFYIYKLETNGRVQTKKMLLIK